MSGNEGTLGNQEKKNCKVGENHNIMPIGRIIEKLIVHSSSSIYVVFTILVLVILSELQLSEISVNEI
jgi:hypothetical protein